MTTDARKVARHEILKRANALRNLRLNSKILYMKHLNEAVFRLRQRTPGPETSELLQRGGFNG